MTIEFNQFSVTIKYREFWNGIYDDIDRVIDTYSTKVGYRDISIVRNDYKTIEQITIFIKETVYWITANNGILQDICIKPTLITTTTT